MAQLFGPVFLETVRRDPGKTAIIEDGATLSYGALDARARATAAGLLARGVTAGSRVAVASDSSAVLVTAFVALQYLGAVFAPLSVRLTPEERLDAIRAADVDTLIADPAYLYAPGALANHVLRQVATAPTEGAATLADLMADGAGAELPDPPGADAPAVIIFSSGSNGRPKAVLWSRDGFERQFRRQSAACHIAPGDVLQLAMPLYHAGGLIGVLGIGLHGGATIACHTGPFRASSVLEQIARDRVTIVHWIPTMLRRVVLHLEETGETPPKLKGIHFGSMPIEDDLLERALALFPRALYQTYGSTECGFMAVLTPADFTAGRRQTGRIHTEVGVMIVDVEGRPVPAGETGEVVVDEKTSGMTCYVGDEEMTARVKHDGFIHSGDLARNEGDGYFTVVGRKDAMIITGGMKVYPPEVEAALAAHPDVAEAGVIGLPDPEFGRAVCAFVVPRLSAPSESELREFCRARIASYKVPRRIVTLDEMPRTATGKVAYDALRKLAEAMPPAPS